MSREGEVLEQDDAELDAAWSEFEGEDGNTVIAATDDESTPDDDVDDVDADSDVDEDEDTPEGNDGEGRDEDEQVEEPEEEDGAQEVDAIKQELKTWQGRLKKAKDEFTALEDEKANAPSKAPAPVSQDIKESLSDEERSALDELEQEYPDALRKAIRAVAKEEAQRASSEAVAPVASQLEANKRESEARNIEAHFKAIESEHADMGEIVDSTEFNDWVESLPYRDSVKYQQVLENGNAQQVISMLSDYKGREEPQQPSKDDGRREKQLRAARPVRSRSEGPPKGKPNKNDYDSAWDSAPD